MQRRRRQRERQHNNSARASRFFVHFFAVTARLRQTNNCVPGSFPLTEKNSRPSHFFEEKPWAQLFEGRSALTPRLNSTLISFPFVQKHFLGLFSLLFLGTSNHQLVDKEN